jgi:hypothetical protein
MKAEKDSIFRHFQQLKHRMNKYREKEARRLLELTLNARKAIKSLGEKKKKAEKIISLAEYTRRMETEREKVLPFYESSVEEEERAAAEAAEVCKVLQTTSAVGRDGAPIEEWNYLDPFFQRYNKVLLDVMAIERERDRLSSENSDLRSILKQYLDGISVNEDVINARTPLLVVNNQTNIAFADDHEHRPPVPSTVVEGAHAVMLEKLGQQGASI